MRIKGLEKLIIPLAFVFGMAGGLKGQEIPTNYAKADTNKSQIIFPLEQNIDIPSSIYKFNISIPKNYFKTDTIIHYYKNDTISNRKRIDIRFYDSSGLEIYEIDKDIDSIQKIKWSYAGEDHKLYTKIKNKYYNEEKIYESKENHSYDEKGNEISSEEFIYTYNKDGTYNMKQTQNKYNVNGKLNSRIEHICKYYIINSNPIVLKIFKDLDGDGRFEQAEKQCFEYESDKRRIKFYKMNKEGKFILDFTSPLMKY